MSDAVVTLIALTTFGGLYAVATYFWSRRELAKMDKTETR